jgi:UDP-GlcNAc3NAcA epimerase
VAVKKYNNQVKIMKIKIVTIIGARPQIIKAAALSRAIRTKFRDHIEEIIVHTGQHYDENMSEVFFEELEIPRPDYNLGVGSASHGVQTARMIEGIEKILLTEKPDFMVLYGDTNSTLAGAVAASKLHIPVAHIEAGLRSFNKTMPEEINRILCDHCSTLLFSPTKTGFDNLIKEGFNAGATAPYNQDNPCIYHCGDVMFDNSLHFAEIAEEKSTVLAGHNLIPNTFILSTIHRDNNTDQPERLNSIFRALLEISVLSGQKIVLPIHPRTTKMLPQKLEKALFDRVNSNSEILIIPPASFLDMIVLEKNTSMVITDSGGVQKEAYFFEKPCIILRSETEWKEIVEVGAAIIANADEERIISAWKSFQNNDNLKFTPVFGNGEAAEFICEAMIVNAALLD